MPTGRPLRRDADLFRQLLDRQKMPDLWHFTPLSCVPCILLHGAVFSIEEADRRRVKVPTRASREDDVRRGIGDVVKVSTRPYWKMLSLVMRQGIPNVLMRFSNTPVLWAGTSFGDRNAWENGWRRDDSYEFAERFVFTRPPYAGGSPPEVYVERELPLTEAVAIHGYLGDETRSLEDCLKRLGLASPVRIMTARQNFPDSCRADYMSNRGSHIEKVNTYFDRVSIESLGRGVEIDDD
jgi:hypothetical protein